MAPNRLLAAEIPMPRLEGPGPVVTDGVTAVEKLIGQVVGILTILAVVYFAIQVILAGYAFINSEGDEKRMEMARHRLTNGVLGLTIVIVAMGLASLVATLAGIPNVMDLGALFSKMGL